MSEERPPEMGDDFRGRMRQGLSSMAVRERLRERRRNRAIAGGALAAIVVATVAVIGSQALGGAQLEQDRAQPGTTQTPGQPPAQTPGGTDPGTSTPPVEPPVETGAPTPPPGLEGVAAREAQLLDVATCAECGDAGSADGAPVEGRFDVYLVCEGRGTVSFGGVLWVDCAEHPAGTGFAQLGVVDTLSDGDPQLTASSDFDGRLSRVDEGAPAVGEGEGGTATVWVTCSGQSEPVVVGGVTFDCGAVEAPEGEMVTAATFAAWGVPILPGEIAPRLTGAVPASLSFVVER